MTCVQESSLICMTGVQFLVELHITIHAQAGAGVVVKLVLEQGVC